jgi:hypothetical protein
MVKRAQERDEDAEFWARRFAADWYRGEAHLPNDFRRFASTYRVPPEARAGVLNRVGELLDDPAE